MGKNDKETKRSVYQRWETIATRSPYNTIPRINDKMHDNDWNIIKDQTKSVQ